MYRIISPSRTNKSSSPTHFPYGRGVSERRWRSAANRPSRQARRGWASLYEAPSQKKNHLPRATKIQQPKNSPLAPTSSPAPPPPKNPSPCSPRIKRKPPPGFFGPNPGQFGSEPGFFGPNPGQFGSEPGYFGSILGRFQASPGQNRTNFGPRSPSREPPPPREMCKNFTSQPAHANTALPSRFPKITQNNTILSQITRNLLLSVYR